MLQGGNFNTVQSAYFGAGAGVEAWKRDEERAMDGWEEKERDESLREDIVQPRAGSTKLAAVYRSASFGRIDSVGVDVTQREALAARMLKGRK